MRTTVMLLLITVILLLISVAMKAVSDREVCKGAGEAEFAASKFFGWVSVVFAVITFVCGLGWIAGAVQ